MAYASASATTESLRELRSVADRPLIVIKHELRVLTDQLEALRRSCAGRTVDDEWIYPSGAALDPSVFGLATTHIDGTYAEAGHSTVRFPMHSISKVFLYALALEDNGREATLGRIGVEPSPDPYNAVSFLPAGSRPRNPMVNAGALVAAELIHGAGPEERSPGCLSACAPTPTALGSTSTIKSCAKSSRRTTEIAGCATCCGRWGCSPDPSTMPCWSISRRARSP